MTTKKIDIIDPTLATTEIVIEGKTYKMCLNLRALAQAEAELIAQGHEVNILQALPVLTLNSAMVIFAASLRKFHPELSFDEAKNLLTYPCMIDAASKIAEVWNKSMDSPSPEDKENPTQAAE